LNFSVDLLRCFPLADYCTYLINVIRITVRIKINLFRINLAILFRDFLRGRHLHSHLFLVLGQDFSSKISTRIGFRCPQYRNVERHMVQYRTESLSLHVSFIILSLQ